MFDTASILYVNALFILLSLLRLWNIWLLGALLLALIFVPIGYSYFLHKKGI